VTATTTAETAAPVRRPVTAPTIVTGASGWLGRALVRAFADATNPLHRGTALRVLLAGEQERPALDEALAGTGATVEVVLGDVTDPATVERLLDGAAGASLIHTAAVIHPPTVADFERVNVGGTRAVVAGARAAGVRRLVHVSSNSPFGANPAPDDRFRADEPYQPYLGYGRSKMAAEQLVLDAGRAGDLDVAVVRPPWFYGPWQPARQTSFFRIVRRGIFPLMGSGRNRRSMVYVDNLVDGVDAADRVDAASGRAFWVADARPYEMNEVIAAVRAALTVCGVPPTRAQLRVPTLVGGLARFGDGLLQGRGRYVAPLHVLGEMDMTIACDIGTTREVLGYEPAVALTEGMVRSVRWCLERGIDL
jgi:nucleoside-diphosphate-sugar epimerase